ncbi:MAG TPA: PRC-barrel domain-containing protein [Ferrovibrio sp.]|uniref:PRC-barrel domain-containing protein n=1 Tax=Ferrovibrio sp. TaxID=1917215 RepID=UPI002ED00D63
MQRLARIFPALGAAFTAAMFAAGMAYAQQQPAGSPGPAGEPGGRAPPVGSGPMTPVPGTGTAEVKGNRLIGADVKDISNEKIGDVSEVLVTTDGRVSGIVVAVGDILGLGGRKVVLPWEKLRFSSEGNDLVVIASTGKDALKAMHDYDDRPSRTDAPAEPGDMGSSRSSTHDMSRPIRPVPSE